MSILLYMEAPELLVLLHKYVIPKENSKGNSRKTNGKTIRCRQCPWATFLNWTLRHSLLYNFLSYLLSSTTVFYTVSYNYHECFLLLCYSIRHYQTKIRCTTCINKPRKPSMRFITYLLDYLPIYLPTNIPHDIQFIIYCNKIS